jgi:hypothetical protein
LGQEFVVEHGISEQRLFQVFAAHEMMGLQDVRNATIETLDHAVGLLRAQSPARRTVDRTHAGRWLAISSVDTAAQ